MPASRQKSKKISFNKTSIEAIKPPQSGRSYVRDSKVPGLVLCTTAAGSKSFYWYRRTDKGPERVHLGRWPGMTVEQARTKAAVHNGERAQGKSPADENRRKQGAPTLEVVFEEFIVAPTRTKSKRPKSAKTVKDYRLLWDAHLKELWGKRKLSAITRKEIKKLHNTIATTPSKRKKSGVYTANRVLSLIRVIYNHAIEEELYETNPATLIRAFEEQSRERFIGEDEIAKFMAEVEVLESETVRDFIKLALFTGQRRGNVQSMRWEDINFDLGVWNIPQTKTGRHTVPLTDEALQVLQQRFKSRGNCEYVLPGRHGKGHLKDPMKQWRAILDRAGLKDLRIHDLRRTLGSWQAGTGSSLPTIGKTMGHKRPETTAIYSRLELKPVRDSMQAATTAITRAAKPKKTRKKKAK